VIQIVKSKLAKTRILMKNENLRKYIPTTVGLKKESLSTLLTRYTMVYVKPDLGKGGVGVMRVEQLTPSMYKLQYDTQTHHYHSIDSLYESILKRKRKGPYLIQQGIWLLQHQQSPFDIRVLVQRNPKGRWETTGVIGRVAHQSKIVTNYHSGGTPIAYEVLMKTYLSHGEVLKHLNRLQSMGIKVAHHMKTFYPGIKEIGLDIGLDSNFHPWLLEVNTIPNPFIFKKLKDKSVYRKISRYAAAYGRFGKRYCPELARKRKV
jgi:hypothetical protein